MFATNNDDLSDILSGKQHFRSKSRTTAQLNSKMMKKFDELENKMKKNENIRN